MRSLLSGTRRVFWAALGIGLLHAARLSADDTAPDQNASPADLVRAALRSELNGSSQVRQTLLADAVRRDPDFAPARWQLGFVKWDGQWQTLEHVAKTVKVDKQLAAYRAIRDELVDTADNHRTLALWCRKHKLAEEERIHWAKVLQFEPDDAEAIAGLRLHLFEDRLLTHQQIEDLKKHRSEQHSATQHWHSLVVKWHDAIDHGSPKDRAAAIDALHELSDPEASPALETAFALNVDTKRTTEMNRLLIETVGRIAHPEATSVLLRRALIPDSLETRTSAAAELKKRPMFTYVPQLIAAMPDPTTTEAASQVYVLPGGAVLSQVEIHQKGSNSEFYLSHDLSVGIWLMSHDMPQLDKPLIGRELAFARRQIRSAAAVVKHAQKQEQINNRLRDRLRFVLQQTTGFDDAGDPKLWEAQWNDYSGTYTNPVFQAPYRSYSAYGNAAVSYVVRLSCFPPGTPVLTIAGPMPIEKIRGGDRVLAQDPQTGELSFRCVQGTTLRPPTPLIKLGLGAHTLSCTKGHPFWVIGKGWRFAKDIKPDDRLHGINGAVMVESVEEDRPSEAYNLIVSDMHNYFVGEDSLLVHDNAPLEEASTLVPGLPAEAEPNSAPVDANALKAK